MIRTSEKTFGIKPCRFYRPKRIAGKQRYCIVLDSQEHLDLNYARPEKAMQEAEAFAKQCYKNFTDFQGNQVVFTFRKIL